MKELLKGGLVCLLYCLLVVRLLAQHSFSIEDDPSSRRFGTIGSPKLSEELIQTLEKKELSFDEWASFFDIRINGASRPVLGSYTISADQVVFKPRFLPDPNVSYQVSFTWKRLEAITEMKLDFSDLVETISFTSLLNDQAEIIGIFPAADTLPANTLRFYIHFSSSMGFENPYDFIKLFDGKGDEITDPFVELPEGLWNENRTRLTVLFHPGRVKRGVGPNVKYGAILKESEKCTINISNQWLDGNGNPLKDGLTKEIIVSPAKRSKMNLDDWKIETNCNQGCSILLTPHRLIDAEMSKRLIRIIDDQNQPIDFELEHVEGNILITSEDLVVTDEYSLIINPRLEDICGNTFLNSFDYEEGSRVTDGDDLILQLKMGE